MCPWRPGSCNSLQYTTSIYRARNLWATLTSTFLPSALGWCPLPTIINFDDRIWKILHDHATFCRFDHPYRCWWAVRYYIAVPCLPAIWMLRWSSQKSRYQYRDHLVGDPLAVRRSGWGFWINIKRKWEESMRNSFEWGQQQAVWYMKWTPHLLGVLESLWGADSWNVILLIIFQACERVAVLGARSVDSKGRTLYSGVKLLINVT